MQAAHSLIPIGTKHIRGVWFFFIQGIQFQQFSVYPSKAEKAPDNDPGVLADEKTEAPPEGPPLFFLRHPALLLSGAFSASSKYRVLLPKKGNNRVKMVKLLKQGYQILL
jgi:hypothetical protein